MADLGEALQNSIINLLGLGPPRDMSMSGGYMPATNGYNPTTAALKDPGVGLVPSQPASWQPQQFNDPHALRWVLQNNPQLYAQMMQGNQAMAGQQLQGQQQFGLQNNVNPSNPGAVGQADQLSQGLLPSTMAAKQAGNQASGTGSIVDMLKNLGVMPQAYQLGSTTAQAGIGQNNLLSQQFHNGLQQAVAAAPYQQQLGQSGARTQLGTEEAQRQQAGEQATQAGMTNQFFQQNPGYIPGQMKTQALAAINQANAPARTPTFAGGTTTIYDTNNTPSGFVSEQYPTYNIKGLPQKMAPLPTYQPSGIFRGKEDFLGHGGGGQAISTPLGLPSVPQRQIPQNPVQPSTAQPVGQPQGQQPDIRSLLSNPAVMQQIQQMVQQQMRGQPSQQQMPGPLDAIKGLWGSMQSNPEDVKRSLQEYDKRHPK